MKNSIVMKLFHSLFVILLCVTGFSLVIQMISTNKENRILEQQANKVDQQIGSGESHQKTLEIVVDPVVIVENKNKTNAKPSGAAKE